MPKQKLTDKYEYLFEKQIIYRGNEYYQIDRVTSVIKAGNRYIAKVAGSYDNDYTVRITTDKKGISMYCDCPYQDNCKHEYATLMAIDNKEYNSIKLLPVEGPDEIKISDLLKVIPENKLKKFLKKSFDIHGVIYEGELIEEFEIYLPEKSREYFYNRLFNDFQLDDFSYNLNKCIRLAEKALRCQKYNYAFLIISSIIDAYKDSQYEDEERKIFNYYNTFAAIIRIANRKGNKKLKAKIQKWIEVIKGKNYYDDMYLEDMIEMIK